MSRHGRPRDKATPSRPRHAARPAPARTSARAHAAPRSRDTSNDIYADSYQGESSHSGSYPAASGYSAPAASQFDFDDADTGYIDVIDADILESRDDVAAAGDRRSRSRRSGVITITGSRSPRPPSNRLPLLLGALVVGALIAFLPGTTAPSQSGTDSGGILAENGYGGEMLADVDEGAASVRKELTAAEAEARLAELRASRDNRETPYGVAFVKPVEGARLTSCFCMRWGAMHWGIDLAAPIGTPIYAAADGVVLEAGPASGFGNVIYIQHDNGDVTVYGHEKVVEVEVGEIVHAGQEIAQVGNEGQSTGPHLHFEVYVGGRDGDRTDPVPWLSARGVSVP